MLHEEFPLDIPVVCFGKVWHILRDSVRTLCAKSISEDFFTYTRTANSEIFNSDYPICDDCEYVWERELEPDTLTSIKVSLGNSNVLVVPNGMLEEVGSVEGSPAWWDKYNGMGGSSKELLRTKFQQLVTPTPAFFEKYNGFKK